ncbi:hypothetical protein N2605_16210 [Bradyrhizobium yuanmingense]|uniref:AbiJ-NTD4 domain-containing protein n=1 Tax=Bradyrhizobium yuanmingense TaxID=108015 RepID=UPI0021A6BC0C|nr:hypothetical protein [Bradyrhizobium sp. CB1024]UWU87920.1 hypothetical protein N2605_16210 [Bradyrhizobium sp. CB1024]
MDDEIARRKKLTFAQAEGTEPLPTQLKRTEVSQELRSVLWNYIYNELNRTARNEMFSYVGDPWKGALKNLHVFFHHKPADEFDPSFHRAADVAKAAVLNSSWDKFYGWIQHLLRVKPTPGFPDTINKILIYSRSPYRVIDKEVLCPIGSDAEAATLTRAFEDLTEAKGLVGGREHLRTAANELSAGRFADSVRESMHAVESVVRVLEPSGEFAKALGKLEGSTNIHGALKKGFLAIYGFSSDEQGIRHPLLDKAAPDVDEADAIFMIGACSAFISYLINKARTAGLLNT